MQNACLLFPHTWIDTRKRTESSYKPPIGNLGTQQTDTWNRQTSDGKKWGSGTEHPQQRCPPRSQRTPKQWPRDTPLLHSTDPSISSNPQPPKPYPSQCLRDPDRPQITHFSNPESNSYQPLPSFTPTPTPAQRGSWRQCLSLHPLREPRGVLSYFSHTQNSYTLLSSPLL